VPCRMSEVPCRTSKVTCLMSEVPCLMSEVSCLMREVPCRMSEFPCLMREVPCVMSDWGVAPAPAPPENAGVESGSASTLSRDRLPAQVPGCEPAPLSQLSYFLRALGDERGRAGAHRGLRFGFEGFGF
jgi:hypothetical protein